MSPAPDISSRPEWPTSFKLFYLVLTVFVARNLSEATLKGL